MNDLLQHTAHRPYPLNPAPPLMRQDWMDLAFLHWPVDIEVMRPHIPMSMELDTFDGKAWLGVVPFWMEMFTPGWPLKVSKFRELNVRTYVRVGDKTGVFFFSLDATSWAAVLGARTLFHLPYYNASIKLREHDGLILYDSVRTFSETQAKLVVSYKGIGEVFRAPMESLEYFLTERYCLFTEHEGVLYCCDIHHLPWPLQMAEVEIQANTMADFIWADLSSKPHAMYVKRIETCEWMLQRQPVV
jgi:uncharacterized protein YqjF (DUF2071 family)